MRSETSPGDTDEGLVDVELARAKIRSSKRILLSMAFVFASASWFLTTVRPLLLAITVISSYHLFFHVWCDTEEPETLLSRHGLHVYLVMASNLILMWSCSNYRNVFARCLFIIVEPLAFVRDAGAAKHIAIFLPLHVVMSVYICRASLFEEGLQWIGNLLIVDAMVVDIYNLKSKISELGRLLQIAYNESQRTSEAMMEHLLTSLCDAFVVINEDMVLTKDSNTLGAMLSKNQENEGNCFLDYVDYDDRDRCREHFQDEQSSQSMERNSATPLDQCVASSLKLNLLHGSNRPLDALLFFAKIWGPDGEYIHYIGISGAWQEKKLKKKASAKSRISSGSGTPHQVLGANPSQVTCSSVESLSSTRTDDSASSSARRRTHSPRPGAPQ